MSDPTAVVTAALATLPNCGMTCIQKLPEWTQPLTSTALNSVCTNLQTDLNLFSTCVGGLCNSTDLLKNQQLLTLVPTGCRYIGFNTTGIVLPDLAPLVPKATATAVATTKSGAFEMFYIGATSLTLLACPNKVNHKNMATNSPADQVALVSKYLDTLPVCDIACLQTLPEWTSPLTADAFVSVCKNLSVDLNQFATCAVSRCTASDIAGVKVLLPLVKEGCNYLGIDVSNVAIPDLTAVVTGSVTAIATATVPTNAVATTQAIATATGVAGSDPLAIANSIIAGLPVCAQTCLSKLPEWTSQDNITIAAITTACNNLQADVNIFATCVGSQCTNSADVEKVKGVLALVSQGCAAVGVTSNINFPTIGNSTVAATATTATTTAITVTTALAGAAGSALAAATTTKSGAVPKLAFGLMSAIITVMFV
ncbi:hypothetical protein HDU79_004547 [Rhizoclosmatium sp. JEL0117]|nr:hypothetical protein HDU79_004547 [Rhizoclosmatium sp. JEL0117]